MQAILPGQMGCRRTGSTIVQVPSRPVNATIAAVREDGTDERLLRRCAEGDGEGLRELMRRYQPSFYRWFYHVMGNAQDAEDATIQLFMRAWNGAGKFEYRASVKTWLYRIAFNIARNARDAKQARPKQVDWESSAASLPAAPDVAEIVDRSLQRQRQAQALNAALQRLRPADRTVLTLYYIEDCSYEEIQEITGVPYHALKTRLSRARARLREELSGQPGWTSI